MSLATSEAVGREAAEDGGDHIRLIGSRSNETSGAQDRRRQRRGRSSGRKHRTVESGLGRAGGIVLRPVGSAVERLTGATLKPANPSCLSPSSPRRGRKGETVSVSVREGATLSGQWV